MTRSGFCLLSGIFAIGLLVPGFSYAEENQILNSGMLEKVEAVKAVETTPASDAQEPNSCESQQQVTVEQLNPMHGAKRVCAAYCGNNPSNRYCTSVCGDAAGCINNYCVYF